MRQSTKLLLNFLFCAMLCVHSFAAVSSARGNDNRNNRKNRVEVWVINVRGLDKLAVVQAERASLWLNNKLAVGKDNRRRGKVVLNTSVSTGTFVLNNSSTVAQVIKFVTSSVTNNHVIATITSSADWLNRRGYVNSSVSSIDLSSASNVSASVSASWSNSSSGSNSWSGSNSSSGSISRDSLSRSRSHDKLRRANSNSDSLFSGESFESKEFEYKHESRGRKFRKQSNSDSDWVAARHQSASTNFSSVSASNSSSWSRSNSNSNSSSNSGSASVSVSRN